MGKYIAHGTRGPKWAPAVRNGWGISIFVFVVACAGMSSARDTGSSETGQGKLLVDKASKESGALARTATAEHGKQQEERAYTNDISKDVGKGTKVEIVNVEKKPTLDGTIEERNKWEKATPRGVPREWIFNWGEDWLADKYFHRQNETKTDVRKMYPSLESRISALLSWYGSGNGKWTVYPVYERFAGYLAEWAIGGAEEETIALDGQNLLDDKILREGSGRFLWTYCSWGRPSCKKLSRELVTKVVEAMRKEGDKEKTMLVEQIEAWREIGEEERREVDRIAKEVQGQWGMYCADVKIKSNGLILRYCN